MKKVDEGASYHPGRPGSSGGEVGILPHWTQMLQCSDGRFVCGSGDTKESAESDVRVKRTAAEFEISSAPQEQIKIILDRAGQGGKIYDEDQQRLFRLICKLILKEVK